MFQHLTRPRGRLLLKIAIIVAGAPALLWAFSFSPPLAHTGGFGEPTCSECHGTGDNSTTGTVSLSGLPATYTAGATVPITVVIEDTTGGRRRWGFELSARFGNGKQAGTLSPGTNVGVDSQNAVQYAHHEPAQNFTGSTFSYTFNWTAPADASGGDVIFNVVGNAANGNGTNDSGDHIYKAAVTSKAPSAAAAPKISSGGIVSAASFALLPSDVSAPGALVSIFGSNMASDVAEAKTLPLPTQLGNTQVLVNGIAAPLFFVSPLQINAQVPFEVQPGSTVNVVVRVSGQDSPPEPLKIEDVSPGIFTIPSLGTGPGAILHTNFTLVNSSSPAKPGEFVLVYATGLGVTNPSVSSGAGGNAERTVNAVTATIGGKAATVDFAGAAPVFAALYQVNIIVPDLTAGDHDVILTVANHQSAAGVKISVSP